MLVIELSEEIRIEIARRNRVQCRTILLTLLEGGLLSADDVAEGLGLSKDRVRALGAKLREHDASVLIDQRRGAQRETRVTPELRAELIQQYVLNVVTNASTSSRQLSADLQQRCGIKLAGRTLRHHVDKLKLRSIGTTLRQRLSEAKKNSAES
jgi:biotin operon repressor